jgi:hypothetical protein
MTTIRTTCPHCGAVEMGVDAVVLSIRDTSGTGIYRFLCPACSDLVEKPADRNIVAVLVSAGVDLADPNGGAETVIQGQFDDGVDEGANPHPESHAGGPALTLDDLLAFHLLLGDDEQLERALPSS